MRHFLDKWYGDYCPPWTWPVTVGCGIVGALLLVFTVSHFEHLACEAKGGNIVKRDGCYLVTERKID